MASRPGRKSSSERGCCLRRENRQTVVDGSGEGAVSRDGKEGNLAEGEGVRR
jgi:hypothetical protein